MDTTANHAYLDNAATTPIDAEVRAVVDSAMRELWANPSSAHGPGRNVRAALERSRQKLATMLKANRLIFTAGGTESTAIGLLGAAANRSAGHVLVSAIEHDATLGSAKMLQRMGHQVEQMAVDADGCVNVEAARSMLRSDTWMVALMAVNNETGAVQPVKELAQALSQHKSKPLFFVDAVQAFGVLPCDLDSTGADMVAVSSHKLHGPKGVGCLALGPGVEVQPLWGGGGQELTLRSGTENVPAIAGFAKAAELGKGDPVRLGQWLDDLAEAVLARIDGATVFGDPSRRAPHIRNVLLPANRAGAFKSHLAQANIAISAGAACHGDANKQSHVLRASEVDPSFAPTRFSVARMTTADEVAYAVDAIRRF